MKHLNHLIIIILLALTFPCNASDFSAVSPSGHTFYYNVYGNIACLMRNDNAYSNYSGTIVIPDSVTNPNNGETYPVTYIGSLAFYQNTGITNVVMGNNIDTIGVGAFKYCYNLVSVTLPNNIKAIDVAAFYECINLETIVLPNDLELIGDYAFYCCYSLDTVVIPNGVRTLEEGVFSHCNNLSCVYYLADSCTSICSFQHPIFESCGNLSTVTIGTNVKSVPCNLFCKCQSLSTVYFNADSCVFMGGWNGYIFMQCPNLENVVIGNNVKNIPANAFRTCSGIENLVVPENISYIGDDAFYGCYSLVDVTLLPIVAPTYSNAFSNTNDSVVFHLPCGSYNSYVQTWGNLNYDEPVTSLNITFSTNNSGWGCASAITVPPMYTNVRCDSSVVIQAIANYGYHFDHWNNYSCRNPDTLFLTENDTIEAIFAKNQYFVSGIPNYYERGIVTGSDTVEYLDSVTLFAFPNYGYHFVRWSDFSTCNPYVVLANQNKELTVVFAPNTYEVNVGTTDSVSGMAYGSGTFDYLSMSYITAIPSYGYHFVQWTDGDITNPRSIILTQDTSFTAQFERNIYHILGLANNDFMGVVTGSDSTLYQDSITLAAIPNYGYHFTQWNDANTSNPRTIEVTKDSLFTACFDYNQYAIMLDVDTCIHGSVSGGGTYNYLSERTISATANYGYHFTQWSDGDTNNPRVITLTQDTSFTAIFERNSYIVSTLSDDTVKGYTISDDTMLYLDSVTISAIANYGYHFVQWNDGSTDNPHTVQVTGNLTYIAQFDYNQYSIALNVDTLIHGTVTGEGLYNYLSEQTITATANYGYHFTAWNDGDTNNPRTITLTQDTLLTALFARNQYTLTLQSDDVAHGSVIGGGVFDYLDTVAIEATPIEHYHFVHWSDGNTDNPRQYVITGDNTIIATFAIDTHHVSVESCNIAFGSVAGGGDYEYGTPATVTATAYSGYQFAHWSNGDTHNPYTFAVLQDTTLVAIFEAETQGINDVLADVVNVYTIGGQIVVETEIEDEIGIYDIFGRKVDAGRKTRFDVPASGVYLVKIGTLPTQKVVVVK